MITKAKTAKKTTAKSSGKIAEQIFIIKVTDGSVVNQYHIIAKSSDEAKKIALDK